MTVLAWHLAVKDQDYVFARPALVSHKRRKLELAAGARRSATTTASSAPPTTTSSAATKNARLLAWFTARLLLAERHRRGTPRGSRALTCV